MRHIRMRHNYEGHDSSPHAKKDDNQNSKDKNKHSHGNRKRYINGQNIQIYINKTWKEGKKTT